MMTLVEPTRPFIKCTNCNKLVKAKCFKYHKCQKAIPSDIQNLAWLGDTLHQLDVQRWILTLGVSANHTQLMQNYTSGEAQVRYLQTTTHHAALLQDKPSTHTLSTYFEFLYATDTEFRRQYHLLMLPRLTFTHSFVNAKTP